MSDLVPYLLSLKMQHVLEIVITLKGKLLSEGLSVIQGIKTHLPIWEPVIISASITLL
jgi:hypothetical protein